VKITLGDKYYKADEEGNIEIIRVQKIKTGSIIVLDDKKERHSISEIELDDYTRLKPDAYITFSIVTLEQNMRDIIVSMHRRKDIDEGIEAPYAACRQNILDIFANQIVKNDTYYIGCSMSKDTCPSDVDFGIIIACNSIHKMYMVSAYIDDRLTDWLDIVPSKQFDTVLVNIFGNIANANLQGYSKTLKELLEVNCFMYDFHKGFNIDQVPFNIKYNEDTFELDFKQTKYLEDLYKVEISRTYVAKFTKEISLSKIKRYYVLINDMNDNLFVIAYDMGKYINRTFKENLVNKKDLVELLKYKMRK